MMIPLEVQFFVTVKGRVESAVYEPVIVLGRLAFAYH